jgi:DNA-binding transcriptional regulator YiaG
MTNEWLSSSGLWNNSCGRCGVDRLDHDDELMGHGWHASASETITEQESQARIRTLTREREGKYAAPLPPPSERRRIREAAGATQKKVADKLHVSRHTVAKFERRAGWVNGRRLPGREPTGAVRSSYSELLKNPWMMASESPGPE